MYLFVITYTATVVSEKTGKLVERVVMDRENIFSSEENADKALQRLREGGDDREYDILEIEVDGPLMY